MSEYRIVQDGQVVAAVDSPTAEKAWQAIKHYAAQYADEGPLVIQERRGKKWHNRVQVNLPTADETPR